MELKDKKLQQKDTSIEHLKKEKMFEKHNLLLREFGNIGSIIYIIKVKTFENGDYIVKIGESRRGIESRYNEHRYNYEECIILDCFLVNRSKDFEKFLHNHEAIKPTQAKNYPKHENENELFFIGQDLTYIMLLEIIRKNIKTFQDQFGINDIDLTVRNLLNEFIPKISINNQQQKEININDSDGSLKNLINELIHQNQLLHNQIGLLEKNQNEKLEDQTKLLNEIKETLTSQYKSVTGYGEINKTRGPRLQKINPDTFEVIKVYEIIQDLLNEDYKIKSASLNKAIIENTIYNGFRWMYVDKKLDANIVHNIQPNKITRPQNLGYIAKVDVNKTKILNVYIDRKTAARLNNYNCESSLDEVVKKKKLSNNHYYLLYNECSEQLRNNFTPKYIILYKDGVGKFDTNNKLIQEYTCKSDCARLDDDVSEKTLSRALKENIMYKNHYYRKLEPKLFI